MSDKLKNLSKRVEELKQQITEEAKTVFKEESARIFDKYPSIKSFSWTGYTPYFNDGEECNYSVYSDNPSINGVDSYKNKDKVLEKAYDEISELINSIDEDTHKEMWGDHAEITVEKDKVTVEGYSHD